MTFLLPWSSTTVDTSGYESPSPSNGVYVIAEIGVNHNGDPAQAEALIAAAKAAGADAVKFQIFNASMLAGEDAELCRYQTRALTDVSSQRDMLQALELSQDALRRTRQVADDLDIDFMATPFGLDDLRYLIDDLSPAAVKIASPDLVNVPLLDAAFGSMLPVIISTGASEQSEIDAATARIRKRRAENRTALLHCISAYPTPLNAARLGIIRYLAERTGLPVGFSDHTMDLQTAAYAVCAGATILERHLTYDRTAIGPDHAMSTEPAEFKRYVELARAAAAAMDGGPRRCADIESDVRQSARGRIIAACTIPIGTRLGPEHLRVQRPANGICPSQWDEMIGKTLEVELSTGEPITWEHLRAKTTAV